MGAIITDDKEAVEGCRTLRTENETEVAGGQCCASGMVDEGGGGASLRRP